MTGPRCNASVYVNANDVPSGANDYRGTPPGLTFQCTRSVQECANAYGHVASIVASGVTIAVAWPEQA